MRPRRRVLALLLCLGTALSFAKDRPNFTGSWKLDPAKSDFGRLPPPTKYELKVDHQEPNLRFITTRSGQNGESTNDAKYVTNGSPATNQTRMGEVKGTASWKGDTLLIENKLTFQGNEIQQQDTWTLSEDGKTLQINSHLASPQGALDFRLSLNKQ